MAVNKSGKGTLITVVIAVLGVVSLAAGLAIGNLSLGISPRLSWSFSAAGVILLLVAAFAYTQRVSRGFGGRHIRYGVNTIVMIAAFAGVLFFANILAAYQFYRFDTTVAREFSLSPQTKSVLANLPGQIKVYAFTSSGDKRPQLDSLLKEYVRLTDKLDFRFIDMDKEPGLAGQYQVQYPTMVFSYGGKQQDLLLVRYVPEYQGLIPIDSSEQEITSALVKVTRNTPKKVYMVSGHREIDIDSQDDSGGALMRAYLEADGYQVEKLSLAVNENVPADASVVIVAGPKAPFRDEEVKAIASYLRLGGKGLIMVDPNSVSIPDLKPLFDEWSIEVGPGVIIETANPFLGDPRAPLVEDYPMTGITKDMQGLETVFPLATRVRARTDTQPPPWVKVADLILTSTRSWLETDEAKIEFNSDKDVQGPIPLAAVAIGETSGETGPKSRIIFVGNSPFAWNAYMQGMPGNSDLFANMVNWLAEEDTLIGVRATPEGLRSFTLDEDQRMIARYVAPWGIPLLVILAGIFVWWRRK